MGFLKMAKNPNPGLINQHTLYISKSGGGKSQAMRQNKALKNGRHLFWDESRDQRMPGLVYYNDRTELIRALDLALRQRYFKIGWDGLRDSKTFEWWCRVIWTIADGKRPLNLWIEELSRVNNSGEARPDHALILNEGRKYGVIHRATTQRPQEITKTAYDNTAIYYIGQQKKANMERFAHELDIDKANLVGLKPLEFYHYDDNSGQQAQKINFKYRELPKI